MENEDFLEIVDELKRFKLDSRIDTVMTNFQVKQDDFVIKYETVKYTLQNDFDGADLCKAII